MYGRAVTASTIPIQSVALPFGKVVIPVSVDRDPRPFCEVPIYGPGMWQALPWAFFLIGASFIPAWFGWDGLAKGLIGAGTAVAGLYMAVFSGPWLEKELLQGLQEPVMTTCDVRPPAAELLEQVFRIQAETAHELFIGGAALLIVYASTGPPPSQETRLQGWRRNLALGVGALGVIAIIVAWVVFFSMSARLETESSLPEASLQLLCVTAGGLAILPSVRWRVAGRGAGFLALSLAWSRHASANNLWFAAKYDGGVTYDSAGSLVPVIDPQKGVKLDELQHVDRVYLAMMCAACVLIAVGVVFAFLFGDYRLMRSSRSEQDPDHPMGRFVVKKSSTGKYQFNLLAANGRVIAISKNYVTRARALKGIDSVKHNAPAAKIDDHTDSPSREQEGE
jgi:uncharacterized protein YegP (UPF0339 family)